MNMMSQKQKRMNEILFYFKLQPFIAVLYFVVFINACCCHQSLKNLNTYTIITPIVLKFKICMYQLVYTYNNESILKL